MASLRSINKSILGTQGIQLIELNNDGTTKLSGAVFETDATISEGYNKTVSVSSYPSEKGINLSESAMVNSFTIQVTGVVSDASLSYFDIVDSIRGSTIGRSFGASTNSQKAWNQLNEWVDKGTPLQVKAAYAKSGFVDNDGVILPFIIENLNIPRDRSTGQALRFSFTLRAIRLVAIGRAYIFNVGITKDIGSQGLTSNQKSSSVSSQASNGRTVDRLVDQKEVSGPFSGFVAGFGQ